MDAGPTVGLRADRSSDGPPFRSFLNLAEDRLPRIFEAFEPRAHGESDGLGLGRYIAREIIRAHGGTIDVESDREHGTTSRMHYRAARAKRATIVILAVVEEAVLQVCFDRRNGVLFARRSSSTR